MRTITLTKVRETRNYSIWQDTKGAGVRPRIITYGPPDAVRVTTEVEVAGSRQQNRPVGRRNVA